MPVIEILAYSPNDMDQFVSFCIEGKPDGKGGYETDDQGRIIGGVLRWLHGREVTEAHFFNSPKDADVQLFVATIERPESYDVPWMKRIPGFEDMIRVDGLVGKAASFASLANPLASVVSNKALDEKFAQGKAHLDHILEQIEQPPQQMPIGKRALLAALRGDVGSDRRAVFGEVQSTFGVSL